MLRIQRSVSERLDRIHVAHFLQVLVIPNGYLLYLVRGTEAVEEVNKRHSALYCRKVCNGCKVHDLLHVALAQHCKAGLTACHNVAVVAEDAKRVRRYRSCGNVEHRRQKLARHLVHIRDHEQQSLRRRVRRRKCACVQRAVYRSRCARFCLHLLNLYSASEDVLLSLCGPLIHKVRHGAGRRDRVDRRYLCKRIAYMCGCLVAVHRLVLPYHIFSSETELVCIIPTQVVYH